MKDQSLQVLIIEDSEDDALLTIRVLKKGGYNPVYERVETAAAMKKALKEKQWEIILCDYIMPKFNAPSALALLKEANIDIPIIIVSGTIGEETAVECMRLGAHDYFMKGKLSRLCPAIARELEDAEVRNKQKNMEKKLCHEEQRFRALVEYSSDMIILINRELWVTYVNPAMERFLGLENEEIIGSKIFEHLHQDDFKLLSNIFNTLFNDTSPNIQQTEIRFRHSDGSWSTFEAVVSDMVNDNVVEAVIVNLRDITERKKAEAKLQQTLERLKEAIGTTIRVLVSAVEARDPYTAGHQFRSAHLAVAIATEMKLVPEMIEGIRMACSIHDIGKLSIPSEILTKPTKLKNTEFSLIKEHSQSGYMMLKDVESPWPLAEIVYQHHERMNGTGYPRNLKRDEILMESRILAVADVVEAMASHRPYRPTLGIEAALEEITKNKGIIYDDAVVDACLKLFREKDYHLT